MHIVALGGAERGFQHLTGKADHAVERSAQLVRHIGEKLRLDARRFLGALFRQVQLDVLNLQLLQRFPQIPGRLIDIVLHLFMVGGERHRHGVDAVFQDAQLPQHITLDAAVELAAANAVDGRNHIANRAGNVAHQAIGEQHGDAETKQQHQGGDKHLFILLQTHRLKIKLDCHIAERIARWLRLFARLFVYRIVLRGYRRAQDQLRAVALHRDVVRQRVDILFLHQAQVLVVIRGDVETVIVVEHGNGADNIGVTAVQQADQRTQRIAVVPGHAVFAGDRQRLDDAGARVHYLPLQFVVAMHHEKRAEQQPDH